MVIIEDAVDIEYVASLYVGILMAVIMAVKASIIAWCIILFKDHKKYLAGHHSVVLTFYYNAFDGYLETCHLLRSCLPISC